MTIEEYNVKCRLLRTACPGLEPHVLLFESGWLLLGYSGETAEEPVVVAANKSYLRAEQEYKSAYGKLVAGGMLRPFLVEREQGRASTKC